MDQSVAPILDAVAAYQRRGELSFTPPGHKQGRGVDRRVLDLLGGSLFAADVLATELDGRHEVGASLEHAEKLMAEAVGADHAFFSTCGSSLSVKAAMLAVGKPGDELLIGRDVHKSVASALVLSGIRPVWLDPCWDADRHLAHPPNAEQFVRALEEHPDACGALVTTPTPYGTCADVAAIATVCHDRGKPLIVDEAWGAHLPFHPDLPIWAMDAGADICVTSVHKMGAGLEQGSVYHQQGGLVDAQVLKSRADLLDTTSPSVLIYAGLDGWRRQMAEHGRELLDRALNLARTLRGQIDAVDGLHVNGRDDFCGPGRAFDLDPLQIVIDVTGLGVTGYQAGDWMREARQINLHLTDHRRISAQLSFADSHATADRLLSALKGLAAARLEPAHAVDVPEPSQLRMEQVMTPREAYFARTELVPAAQAAGRVAAEMLTPYPPGIPAVVPGERLNEAVLRYLHTGSKAGMVVPEAADPEVKSVLVVADS